MAHEKKKETAGGSPGISEENVNKGFRMAAFQGCRKSSGPGACGIPEEGGCRGYESRKSPANRGPKPSTGVSFFTSRSHERVPQRVIDLVSFPRYLELHELRIFSLRVRLQAIH